MLSSSLCLTTSFMRRQHDSLCDADISMCAVQTCKKGAPWLLQCLHRSLSMRPHLRYTRRTMARAGLPQGAARSDIPGSNSALICPRNHCAAVSAGRQRPHASLVITQLRLWHHRRPTPGLPSFGKPVQRHCGCSRMTNVIMSNVRQSHFQNTERQIPQPHHTCATQGECDRTWACQAQAPCLPASHPTLLSLGCFS